MPTPEQARARCSQGHRPGHHDRSCVPPADPTDPELRLLRAIYGLCPVCDHTEAEHEPAGARAQLEHSCAACAAEAAARYAQEPLADLSIPLEDLREMEVPLDG